MMIRQFLGVAAAAALITAAAPASASQLISHVVGTFEGEDFDNALGLGAGAVSGVQFTLDFAFDLDRALIEVQHDEPSGQDTSVALGGLIYGGPSLTTFHYVVGGVAFTVPGVKQSFSLQNDHAIEQSAYSDTPGDSVHYVQAVIDGLATGEGPWLIDVTSPPTGNLCEVASCYGIFANSRLYGVLSPTFYSIDYSDTWSNFEVPEPKQWAFMILGFLGSGIMLRQRQMLFS